MLLSSLQFNTSEQIEGVLVECIFHIRESLRDGSRNVSYEFTNAFDLINYKNYSYQLRKVNLPLQKMSATFSIIFAVLLSNCFCQIVATNRSAAQEDMAEIGLLKVMVHHLNQRDKQFEEELKEKDKVRYNQLIHVKLGFTQVLNTLRIDRQYC